ncbi:unnamed protein product [Linum trigynum]|uniref:Uncharacterized protein n=1 Tax=Linum trigynum TaxID=586398 RepID=A0AAV2FS00_9ROSI
MSPSKPTTTKCARSASNSRAPLRASKFQLFTKSPSSPSPTRSRPIVRPRFQLLGMSPSKPTSTKCAVHFQLLAHCALCFHRFQVPTAHRVTFEPSSTKCAVRCPSSTNNARIFIKKEKVKEMRLLSFKPAFKDWKDDEHTTAPQAAM